MQNGPRKPAAILVGGLFGGETKGFGRLDLQIFYPPVRTNKEGYLQDVGEL
ncbi:MAG TPA: hypothetical protein VGK00_02100 [Anaerolineales bacterium]|jgi:hypothetical protein